MPIRTSQDEETIPLAEEVVTIGKRTVEHGRVRVRTMPAERTDIAAADLVTEEVHIERVLLDRFVDVAPQPRQEGDTLIVPVVEEVAVVEKRLLLREEIRLTRVRTSERFEQPVVLRTTHAVVERLDAVDPDIPVPTPRGDRP
jgi:stress response protein YsnF